MLYPLTFEPIFKEIIWGGTDILPYKGLPANKKPIGESWELSHIKDNISVAANGPLAGKTIDELIKTYQERLLGTTVLRHTGQTFPLLIKFIDARENLSIQVHPNDHLAMKRHHSLGKTEMWYVIKAAPGAHLYSGFSQPVNPNEYTRHIANHTIMDILKKHTVQAGDVFFLPAGRIHAIGAGCFITEIQQTSNITYRIYDYNRKDTNGHERTLHTDLAKDAIDYTPHTNYQTHYTPVENQPTPLVQCPHFTTHLLQLTQTQTQDLTTSDTFLIYICIEGKAILEDNHHHQLPLHQGQTALIPAETKTLTIHPNPQCKLLKTHTNT
jgi:mannose-6-phosphate isomerase